MRPRAQNNLVLVAIVASLLIHGLGFSALSWYYVWYTISHRDVGGTDVVPEVAVVRPDAFGKMDGTGSANNSSLGNLPQKGPQGSIEQAALSEEPEGNALASAASSRQFASASTPQAFRPPTMAFAIPTSPIGRAARVETAPTSGDQAVTVKEQPAPLETTPQPQPTQADAPAHADSSPSVAGSPFQQSDTNSDPFSSEVAAVFERGRMQARQGRDFKMARLNLNLASITQAATIQLPAVMKMIVEIDGDGKVRRVTRLRSTGSTSIDRAIELCIYASWFQPVKDEKTGKPKASDTFEMAYSIE